MSVDPVRSSSPVIERPTPEKKLHAVPTPRSADSTNNPKIRIDTTKAKNIPAPLAIPVHEVKVVLDTADNHSLVYQVLDKESGDVVLQVPSADQLRGIHESQELLQRIAARTKAPASDETLLSVPKTERNSSGH